jgi:hypothetical protein
MHTASCLTPDKVDWRIKKGRAIIELRVLCNGT